MSEVSSNLTGSENMDAQMEKEAIATGEHKIPEINVDADYEASKEFSVSPIDRTAEGGAAAEAATGHFAKVSQPEVTEPDTAAHSDPHDYQAMAKDVSPAPKGATNVTDDLVHKALGMTQPGESTKSE